MFILVCKFTSPLLLFAAQITLLLELKLASVLLNAFFSHSSTSFSALKTRQKKCKKIFFNVFVYRDKRLSTPARSLGEVPLFTSFFLLSFKINTLVCEVYTTVVH